MGENILPACEEEVAMIGNIPQRYRSFCKSRRYRDRRILQWFSRYLLINTFWNQTKLLYILLKQFTELLSKVWPRHCNTPFPTPNIKGSRSHLISNILLGPSTPGTLVTQFPIGNRFSHL